MPGITLCVKTKSNLVVMPSGRQIFAFFALRVTVEPKIPGAVIPRRVFTQPGSIASVGLSWHVGFTPDSGHVAARQRTDASGHFRKSRLTTLLQAAAAARSASAFLHERR